MNERIWSSMRKITQEDIDRYAIASGDFNPIHISGEAAKEAGFEGTIAHGMMLIAYIDQFMRGGLGETWDRRGSMEVRFKMSAQPGDVILVNANATHENEFKVTCINHNNEILVSGKAKLRKY